MRTPPTTAPTTLPVLTDPSLAVVDDFVRGIELGNLDTVDNRETEMLDLCDNLVVTGVWVRCCVVENINFVAEVDTIKYGSNGDGDIVITDLDVEELTNLLAEVESISTEDVTSIIGGSNDVITDNDDVGNNVVGDLFKGDDDTIADDSGVDNGKWVSLVIIVEVGTLLIVALTLVVIFVVKVLIAEVTVPPCALMVFIGMFLAQMVKSKLIGIVALKFQETRVVTYTCRYIL